MFNVIYLQISMPSSRQNLNHGACSWTFRDLSFRSWNLYLLLNLLLLLVITHHEIPLLSRNIFRTFLLSRGIGPEGCCFASGFFARTPLAPCKDHDCTTAVKLRYQSYMGHRTRLQVAALQSCCLWRSTLHKWIPSPARLCVSLGFSNPN